MIDEEKGAWPETTAERIQVYAKDRFNLDVPDDAAEEISEMVNVHKATVHDCLLVYCIAKLVRATTEAFEDLGRRLCDVLREPLKQLIVIAREYAVFWRRVELYSRLPSWMPEYLRDWLSVHWPERWLPELRAVEEEGVT